MITLIDNFVEHMISRSDIFYYS